MARDSNVQAVRDGIHKAFSLGGDEAPTGTAIASAAGVSLSTVNRVLRDHQEVRDALALARASFDSGRGQRPAVHANDRDAERADPVLANPKLAVRRLEQVVAALLAANETLRRDNGTLRTQLSELRDRLRHEPVHGPVPTSSTFGVSGTDRPDEDTSAAHISDYPASVRRTRGRGRY